MSGKKILLGVSGGIAAYKACDIVSSLTKEEIDVHCVLTKSAEQFVSPLTFKTLSRNQVLSDQFDYDLLEPLHIEILKNTDLILLAPATANLISKLANGICDDLLTTLLTAYEGKVLLAPAMNTVMWNNPILQKNLDRLVNEMNYTVIEPQEGELACRAIGVGKLASVEEIVAKTLNTLNSGLSQGNKNGGSLKGMKILVTAGGTKEPIDPVRFIGNRSSGKMGLAIADEAYKRGAEVVLITTQSGVQRKYTVIGVETAHQLQEAVEAHFDSSRILIMAAAVSDFRPLQFFQTKVKKSSSESDWTLPLTKNPDILETLGRVKKPEQILIGFAAESDNLLKNARKKLQNKKLDLIVANEINNPEIGFASDYNEVYLLTQDNNGEVILPKATKREISLKLWDFIESKFIKSN
jgi:phosphopantothenoylcysteine decarboxylase/phosphopantothenate--cysteine ligase